MIFNPFWRGVRPAQVKSFTPDGTLQYNADSKILSAVPGQSPYGSGISTGTNTGDQTITLTGDVTGSGTGSFAATLAVSGVTAATYGDATHVPQIAIDAKGRVTSATNIVITGGSGGIGDVVGPASAVNNRVAFFDGTTGKLIKDSGLTFSGSNTGDQTITLTGDVTGSGAGSFAATIANDAVTYAKMQNMSATARAVGRNTAGAGDPEEVTAEQILDWIGTAAQGDILYRGASATVRLPAGTSGQFLQTLGAGANPAWAAPAAGSGGGLYSGLLSALTTSAGTGLATTLGASTPTITDTAAGVMLATTSAGAGMYTTSVPATPYSIKALITCDARGASATAVAGLGWTDGTKIHFIYFTTAGARNVQRNSNITTFSATDISFSDAGYDRSRSWLQVKDDGTNVIFQACMDGVNFYTVFSVAKASGYLGATGYTHLFVGTPGGSGSGQVTVISWIQGA